MNDLSPSDKMYKGLNTFFEGVAEVFTNVLNKIVNTINEISNDLSLLSSDKWIINQANKSEDKEIIKFLNIYYRTKSKRIKKKQITKMRNKLI